MEENKIIFVRCTWNGMTKITKSILIGSNYAREGRGIAAWQLTFLEGCEDRSV